MIDTPSHLGGHGNTTHLDINTLKYLKKKYDIRTMVDGMRKCQGVATHGKEEASLDRD